MSEASGDKPPRGGLTPAGWTAISAIAVAVIGAIVTLTTSWWQHAPPAAKAETPAAVATVSEPAAVKAEAGPAAAALPDPAQWAGSWIGSAQAPGEARFKVELVISAGCAKDKTCGTISIPSVPCKGRVTLAEVRPEGAEFSVDQFEAGSAAACQPGAGEVFRETPEGALAYTATYSVAKGVLTRVD